MPTRRQTLDPIIDELRLCITDSYRRTARRKPDDARIDPNLADEMDYRATLMRARFILEQAQARGDALPTDV